ncbi:replication endonuclease [Aquabacterium sp.]|uniref:replication endonuclease n=1 Tax=Aquabacterium sp. TaxID=1872578 RepID=UPI0025BEBA9F|nr:replication endonuclease [Aquabacterium sp.]
MAEVAQAVAQIAATQAANRARPVEPSMRGRELRELARQRADMMPQAVERITTQAAAEVAGLEDPERTIYHRERFFALLADVLAPLDARPFVDTLQDLGGIIARVSCAYWWRRQLTRAAIAKREAAGREASEVCAKRRQPYVTHDTVHRMLEQDERNRATLEGTELENADGQVFNLGELAAKSTANPAIRRGELMTRIKGCEAWADEAGWLGIFTTHTTPSRYHATKHNGRPNPNWEAAGRPTIKDGQQWLCKTWARARSALQRRGLGVFGFRVAEPHQDGTPHWHAMLWVEPSAAEREGIAGSMPGNACKAAALLRAYWLADSGDESGAAEHRFKAVALNPGGAAGYCAKYISKGIDGHGATLDEGHHDEEDGAKIVMEQGQLYEGATRVRFWARAHHIRQFQAIGQPPVTAWRELRRVEAAALQFAPEGLRLAWDATNKTAEGGADWGLYLTAQGGAASGRGYAYAVATEKREVVGRYETATQAKHVGVLDKAAGFVARSSRKEWKARGTWSPEQREQARARAFEWSACGASLPRTRVNNCTQDKGPTRPQAPRAVHCDGLRGVDRFAPWLREATGEHQTPPPHHHHEPI